MKTKKKIGLIFLLLLVLITCVVSIFTINTSTETVEAATTPKYTVKFTYKNIKRVTSLGNTTESTYKSGTNVSSASGVKNHLGNNMTLKAYMWGSDYSSTATLENGGYFNDTTANISFDSTFTEHTITVTNSKGTQVKKVTQSKTIQLTGLSAGETYNVEMFAFGIGSGTTIVTTYTLTVNFSFKIDTVAPTITGLSTSSSSPTKFNTGFSVTGTDTGGSGLKYIYRSAPDEGFYLDGIYGTSYVYVDEAPGLYRFYASDYANNTSGYYYAYFDNRIPVGAFYDSSGNEITNEYYNNSFCYKATDEGWGVSYYEYLTPGATSWVRYYNNAMIERTATQGWYSFRAIDGLGNVSQESKIYLDITAPVGKVYANSTVLSTGGKTGASSIYYSATDTGGVDTCYVKAPGSSSYVEYANSASVTESGSYSFYCVDKAGNQSTTYTVLMDNDAPVLSCNNCEFSDTTGGGFAVSCSDVLSSFTLYYKKPNDSSYSSTTSSQVSIPASYSDGKYYFYAVDALGNTSATVWVELNVAVPSAKLVQDENSNKMYATWTDTTVKATLNGNNYTSGAWITEEGDYTLVLLNPSTNRQATYNFTIGHYYECVRTVSPTCTAQGYCVYECISCDSSYYDDFIPANGHTYSETVFKATCTAQGYTIYVCSVCDYTYVGNYVPAKGHSYQREVIEPTCIERGYTLSTCTDCGYSYSSDYVSPLGHIYVSTSFEATCTEKGGIHYACSRCGDEYTLYTSTELGHYYYTELIEPSCEQEGYIKHICTQCNYEYKTDVKSALGHDYKTWVDSEPNCHNDGMRIHQCQSCKNKYYTVIPYHGHEYEIQETETDNGTKRTYVCKKCGDEYVQYLGNQYVMVSEFVDDLFDEYAPYMLLVFLSTAGVWSAAMGIAMILAYKSEDKHKAKRMVKNYVIGLIVIFAILVACPYLIKGIAYLVAH